MACETFDDLLNAEYGERGTVEREKFEVEAETFCLAECLWVMGTVLLIIFRPNNLAV